MTAQLKPLPAWLDLDERRADRRRMNIAAFLETQVHPTQIGVRVIDLSTDGCLLAVPGGLPLGRYVTLMLPGAVNVEGWIAWSKGDQAGLDYARSLPTAVVEQIIGASDQSAVD
ncbi:PilZ domain-containing protein [Sphingomonas sp. Tas61C01]|uniref:PilZ domain-containing protein n=1 Tax=Sphingomonas sp. Tas61C01 TaxID=3458297 RepID=UPI00403E7D38